MIFVENVGISTNKDKILNLDSLYSTFSIKKKNGGYREITAPSKELLEIQKILKVQIEQEIYNGNIPYDDCITGFTKGKGIKMNADFHIQKKFLLNVDISGFFTSITKEHIYNCFVDIVDDIDKFLTLTTYRGYLPQGSPCSPIIANIVFLDIDLVIKEYLKLQNYVNVSYSRYADDISISYDNYNDNKKLLSNVTNIINSFGFNINPEKIKFYNSKTKMIVTGLVVNKRVSFPKYNYRMVRTILFNQLKNGYGYFPHIKGLLSFVKSVDEKKYNLLKEGYGKKFKYSKLYYEMFDIKENGEKSKSRPINFLGKNNFSNNSKKIGANEYILGNNEDTNNLGDNDENNLREFFPDWGSGSFDNYLEANGY